MLVIAGMSALVLDLGRVMAVREQLQTAVDAGSLAGSMQGVRYVKVRVPERVKIKCGECCDEFGCSCCHCETYELPDYIAKGTRKAVWDQGGWQEGCGSCGECCRIRCGRPVIEDQWIEFTGGTERVALQTAEANLPADVKPQEGGGGYIYPDPHWGAIDSREKNDPLAPSVIVKFSGWIKSMLAGGLFGTERIDVNSCGQSGTFFFKLDSKGRQTGTTNRKPQPG